MLADHPLLRVHYRQTESTSNLGADAESEIVMRGSAGGKDSRWPAQAYHNLRAGRGQRLAGPNVKRHVLPSPGVDVQLQSGEGFDFRVGRDALFVLVAAKLAANNIL